jgi:hypothetical protein
VQVVPHECSMSGPRLLQFVCHLHGLQCRAGDYLVMECEPLRYRFICKSAVGLIDCQLTKMQMVVGEPSSSLPV